MCSDNVCSEPIMSLEYFTKSGSELGAKYSLNRYMYIHKQTMIWTYIYTYPPTKPLQINRNRFQNWGNHDTIVGIMLQYAYLVRILPSC